MHFDRLWALFDYDLESEIKTETDIELVKKNYRNWNPTGRTSAFVWVKKTVSAITYWESGTAFRCRVSKFGM